MEDLLHALDFKNDSWGDEGRDGRLLESRNGVLVVIFRKTMAERIGVIVCGLQGAD
jgi:hypothetical protein